MDKKQTALRILIEDYQRKLANISALIQNNTNNGSVLDERRDERLKTKAAEYRSFIADLERQLPVERELIKDAHKDGGRFTKWSTAEYDARAAQYYTTTFLT